MIQSYKSKANLGIGLGLLLNIGSRVFAVSLDRPGGGDQVGLAVAVIIGSIVGTVLFIWGCVMYARAKDRNGWWGAFGLLSLIGLIVLVCLKDFAPEGHAQRTRGFDPIMRR